MPTKAELAWALEELEAEYRYWVVEAISIERGIENIEEKIDLYATELGPARVSEFRARLSRTREQHDQIEARIRFVRSHLEELRSHLETLS